MEKSIIFASFLLILSITTTFLKNCNYETQFPNQKLTCKILQTTAGTFSTRAPQSSAKNSPPPQQFFDWFCQHKYKPKKLYSHIILFSPTISTNLKFLPKSMPHSPSNRAKRYRMSQQENQIIPQTDSPNSINPTNLINLPTIATHATNINPTADRVNQVILQTDLPNLFTSIKSTNSPSLATSLSNSIPTANKANQAMSHQVNQVNHPTDLPTSPNSTRLINLPTMATSSTNLIPTNLSNLTPTMDQLHTNLIPTADTELFNQINSINIIKLPTIATNSTNLIPTAEQGNQTNPHIDLPGTSNSPTNPITTTNLIASKQSASIQKILLTDLPNLFTSTQSTNSPSSATNLSNLISTMDQINQLSHLTPTMDQINQLSHSPPSVNASNYPPQLTNLLGHIPTTTKAIEHLPKPHSKQQH